MTVKRENVATLKNLSQKVIMSTNKTESFMPLAGSPKQLGPGAGPTQSHSHQVGPNM